MMKLPPKSKSGMGKAQIPENSVTENDFGQGNEEVLKLEG
jgi:hypothetical protein